jgi:hypothetical protein
MGNMPSSSPSSPEGKLGGFSGGGGLGKIGGDSSEGGGGGGSPSPDNSGSMPGESTPGTDEEPESADPEEDIVNTVKNVTTSTKDPQKALKAVKSIIQKRYTNPDEAVDVLSKLIEDDDPVMKSITRRLALYILGK